MMSVSGSTISKTVKGPKNLSEHERILRTNLEHHFRSIPSVFKDVWPTILNLTRSELSSQSTLKKLEEIKKELRKGNGALTIAGINYAFKFISVNIQKCVSGTIKTI